MVATTHTVCLRGANGHVVDVQADLSDGLIAMALVGRPDASITEARDRCRAAVTNSGFTWPTPGLLKSQTPAGKMVCSRVSSAAVKATP